MLSWPSSLLGSKVANCRRDLKRMILIVSKSYSENLKSYVQKHFMLADTNVE